MAEQGYEHVVIGVLQELTQDWDLELPNGIHRETCLMEDLECESIDIVQFAVSLEKALDQKGLPFEKLFMDGGEYVDDLSVTQVADFLRREAA